MSRIKALSYPFLLTAVAVLAATEGAWRLH